MLVRFSKKQRDSEESNSGENMFRVIIAGSRSFANYEMLKANMNRLLQNISCEGYGDDYSVDKNGELVHKCETCPNNPFRGDLDD